MLIWTRPVLRTPGEERTLVFVVASIRRSACEAPPWGDLEPVVMDSAPVSLAHFLPICLLIPCCFCTSQSFKTLPANDSPGFLYPISIPSHSHHIHCAQKINSGTYYILLCVTIRTSNPFGLPGDAHALCYHPVPCCMWHSGMHPVACSSWHNGMHPVACYMWHSSMHIRAS